MTAAQIVLAAGRSERMGSPKPLLRFGDRTALDLALAAAAGAGVSRSIVVVGEQGQAVVDAHPAGRLPLPVEWVWNLEPGAEQLRSLQLALAAFRAAQAPGFFIHPVDHPLVTASDYGLLLRAFACDAAGEVFLLSHGGRRGHPILCRALLAPALMALPRDASARHVIERSRIAYVVTPNAGVREDMDTPEAYERLRRVHGGGAAD